MFQMKILIKQLIALKVKNRWVDRLKKKQIPKGEEFNQSNETEIINEQADKDTFTCCNNTC